MKTPPVLAALVLAAAVPSFAEDTSVASANAVVDLSDFDAAPDGVSILAQGGDSFKMLSIATAPYKSAAPAALSAARTVAVTKAKAGLSRFLNADVSAEDYMEKQVSKVKVVSSDGTESAVQTVSRRVLTRIRTQSKSLLRGVVVLQTERIPAEEGPGGSLRVVAGVSSATLESAENFEAGIDGAAP